MNNQGSDDDLDPLIRRLNALKPTAIRAAPTNPIINSVPKHHAASARSDLNARFASLSGGRRSGSLTAEEFAAHPESLEPDFDADFNDLDTFDENAESLEDVMAGLEVGDIKSAVGIEDWKGDDIGVRNARDLLKEAKRTLHQSDSKDTDQRELSRHEQRINNATSDTAATFPDANEINDVNRVLKEQTLAADDEAKDVIQEALRNPHSPTDERPPEKLADEAQDDGAASSEKHDTGLTLPAAPVEDPVKASSKDADPMALPAAPTFQPNLGPGSDSSIPSEEDVETWCTICMDDATLQCIDCDGELYCDRCWNEGHKGDSAGPEERRHKALLYESPKKKRQREQRARERKRKVKVGAG